MYKILLLVVCLFAFTNGLVLVSMVSLGIYILKYTSFEIFLVMLLLDGYMGAFYEIPWLSFGTGVALILVTVIKKRLLLYTEHNEVAT
jgi:hypothetical protein